MDMRLSDFKVEANPGKASSFQNFMHRVWMLSWKCVQELWIQHYSSLNALKSTYASYDQFSVDVHYFLIRPQFSQIRVYFRRSSVVFHLCVSNQPSARVLSRGGFHANNGHTALFCLGDNGLVRMKCFDSECSQKCGCQQGDALPWSVSDLVVAEGIAIFSFMRDNAFL
jgi:hypothetical protein